MRRIGGNGISAVQEISLSPYFTTGNTAQSLQGADVVYFSTQENSGIVGNDFLSEERYFCNYYGKSILKPVCIAFYEILVRAHNCVSCKNGKP